MTTPRDIFWPTVGLVVALVVCALGLTRAHAHDRWANGQDVPSWVKEACCGVADVHHIPAESIHLLADGYHIDGIKTVVPEKKALPSPDGTFWVFWNEAGEPEPVIYCFFAPLQGV